MSTEVVKGLSKKKDKVKDRPSGGEDKREDTVKKTRSKKSSTSSEARPPLPSGAGHDFNDLEFYCVKCKQKVKSTKTPAELEKDKRGSTRLKGQCDKCDTKMYRYYKV